MSAEYENGDERSCGICAILSTIGDVSGVGEFLVCAGWPIVELSRPLARLVDFFGRLEHDRLDPVGREGCNRQADGTGGNGVGEISDAVLVVSPKAQYSASNRPPALSMSCSRAARRPVPPSLRRPLIPLLV